MICGIYCITNTANNKKYIGQSRNIEKRWRGHIGDLNRNKHSNSHMQNAWNTYGAQSFSFVIVEICDRDELTDREKYWMDYYNTLDRDLGYNLREAGDTSKVCSEGERNNSAKITEKQAKEVIKLLQLGLTIRKIQSKTNVPYRIIDHIRRKETWIHLTNNITFPCITSSSYRGVSYNKKMKKWVACIQHNKYKVYIDYFDTEMDAAIARDQKAEDILGNEAVLNFPD